MSFESFFQMMMKYFLFILFTMIFGCSVADKRVQTDGNTIKLHSLKKLFVVGDFDNDKETDTIYQHNYSRLTKTEIDQSADPFQNEWDTVVEWFYDQKADLYLTIKNNPDTLHLGTAQGLYCLINIGDNNSDGKDEIAFVIDHCDFSNLNSCKVYTLCKNKWVLLKQFGITEGSFDFITGKPPVFDNIKNYLEKRNGKWVYMDYPDEIEGMKGLDLEKCK